MAKVKKEKTEEQLQKEKETRIFVIRVILWSLFSCVAPVLFIGFRYDLFRKASSLQLSGWGIIAVIIIVVFLYVVTKYIRAGFGQWSFVKQIIDGVIKVVLPLATVLAIAVSIRNNLDAFIQSLSCVLVCEVIAIPVNPFPEWVYKKSKGRFEGMVDFVADRFYNKKEEHKGE